MMKTVATIQKRKKCYIRHLTIIIARENIKTDIVNRKKGNKWGSNNRKVNQCKSKGIKVNCLWDSTDKVTTSFYFTVSPRFTRVPGRFLVIEEGAVASVTCEAFSYPPSVITWTRPLVALPRGRSSVTNGTLTIQDFSAVDTGTYVCTAKNKLGSVTAVMALNIQRKPGIHYNTGFVKF